MASTCCSVACLSCAVLDFDLQGGPADLPLAGGAFGFRLADAVQLDLGVFQHQLRVLDRGRAFGFQLGRTHGNPLQAVVHLGQGLVGLDAVALEHVDVADHRGDGRVEHHLLAGLHGALDAFGVGEGSREGEAGGEQQNARGGG